MASTSTRSVSKILIVNTPGCAGAAPITAITDGFPNVLLRVVVLENPSSLDHGNAMLKEGDWDALHNDILWAELAIVVAECDSATAAPLCSVLIRGSNPDIEFMYCRLKPTEEQEEMIARYLHGMPQVKSPVTTTPIPIRVDDGWNIGLEEANKILASLGYHLTLEFDLDLQYRGE